MKLILAHKQAEAGGVTSYFFDTDEKAQWEAGQYVLVNLDHQNPDKEGTERFFTISAAPQEGQIRITTRVTGSTFKRALDALPVGEELEVREIGGDFTFSENAKSTLFIAGGIGITPFRSMLTDLASRGKLPKITLLYAGRTADLPYKSQLDELAGNNDGLTVDYVIEPEKIDEERLGKVIASLDDPTVYISGPEPMVQALEKLVLAAGIPDRRVKRDFFPGYAWPDSAKQAAASAKVSFIDFMKQGINFPKHFIQGKLQKPDTTVADLKPGQGAIVEIDGKKVAAYKDKDGNLKTLSPTCTHLGCTVHWNGGDHTWDCPCHGSRFEADGAVRQGPAKRPLPEIS